MGLRFFSKKTEPIVSYASDEVAEEVVEKVKVTNAVKKTPASPSSSASPVIASAAPSAFAVPVPEVFVDSPTPEFGESDGFGDGFGDGDGNGFGGGGGGFTALPASMKKRCSPAERLARLKEMGGNEKCEDAVMKGLRWIKRTQNADGSWRPRYQVAMTGFSILCYLGHCETPLSPEFGESVEKGILFLVNKANQNNGKLGTDLAWHGWVYEHAIATYALAEAYTFCKIIGYEIEGLEQAVQQAGNVLLHGQHPNGGWRYAFTYSGHHDDTSVTGFCMQALKACKSTGIKFANLETKAKNGISYIQSKQGGDGRIGYSSKANLRPTMTGAGLLCMQQWGKGKSKEARKALKWLHDNTTYNYTTSDLYGDYYYGQCFMEAGGEYWDKYNKMFRDEILSGQNADGSFKVAGLKHDELHYRTCLAILSLEVYYRFLPGTSKK